MELTSRTDGTRSALPERHPTRLGPVDVLAWSVWFGLVAGLLEVGTRVVCRAIDPAKRLYLMSRHFVWLTPLANMLLFFSLGLVLAGVTQFRPRLGGWLSPRLFCALAIQPALMLAVPTIYPWAWFLVALGISSQLVPWLESRPASPRRSFLFGTIPVLLGVVGIIGLSIFVGDGLKRRAEARRPLPSAGTPNVIVIVLDTVRRDRLSLYGYRRPTTPNLERLASNGIRFDRARAPAPWTLPSHASFFTGRWPHQLDVHWLTPLRPGERLLAEYLGSRGFATAGFVANTGYCSYDTGLAHGFTHYRDYTLEKLAFLRTSRLIQGILEDMLRLASTDRSGLLNNLSDALKRWFYADARKDARSINRAVLEWLVHRPDQARPFFVFLNFMDAHAPYKLPEGAHQHFGYEPRSRDEIRAIHESWDLIDKLTLPRHYLTMARDAYDSCLAYLDEQLGALFAELRRGGLLDNTVVVILADHGEGLGEHDLFDHGESLYSTELNVPLLVLLPRERRITGVVSEAVSLRDLPATVVDLVGLAAGSPFPGQSLAPLWRDPNRPEASVSPVVSELLVPDPRNANQGRSPAYRGPLVSLAEGDYVYIRNLGDGGEQLFNTRDDPGELSNRVGLATMKSLLDRFRKRIAHEVTGDSR